MTNKQIRGLQGGKTITETQTAMGTQRTEMNHSACGICLLACLSISDTIESPPLK